MKKIIIAVSTVFALAAQAQENTLLDPTFWQNKPDVAAVKAEVQKGNSPSQLNGMSFDPVVLAINNQAPDESVKYLLSQPGNAIGKLTHDGRIYLHWAAARGNAALIEYLLSKGSKVDVADSHGFTPLNFAANAGLQDTRVYDLFLDKGADLQKDLTSNGANALLLAIASDNDLALTNYFISKGLDLKSTDSQGNTAFDYAARGGNIDILKALIKRGVPYNDNAMVMASQGTRRGANTLEVYQYLETLKLKPTAIGKNGENVLHNIVRKPGQAEIIRYFLSKGVDVNKADEEGDTPFMLASAGNRDTAVLQLLIPHVKDINQVNKKGVSALAMAVQSNSPEVVDLLLRNGADIHASDAGGNNLAWYLIQSYGGRGAGRGGFVQQGGGQGAGGQRQDSFGAKFRLLKDRGLDLAAPQEKGNTLYHLAVAKNELDLLKRMENLGIDINRKNDEGFTALHRAAMVSKDDAILKYLLSIGARKDILTSFDESAFDLASENESLSKDNIQVNFLK